MVYVCVIMGGIQILMGLPFLLHNPHSYISAAFDFSRTFLYEWTVNWRFLDKETFLHPALSKALLGLHFIFLCTFGLYRWTDISRIGLKWISLTWKGDPVTVSPAYIVLTLCTSNLIGMTFARSLHYQFYSWYALQLPLFAWASSLWLPLRYVPESIALTLLV